VATTITPSVGAVALAGAAPLAVTGQFNNGYFGNFAIVKGEPLIDPGPYGEFWQSVGERRGYGIDWSVWTAQRWLPATDAVAGSVIQPTKSNGFQYSCTQAGLTGDGEPLWPATVGAGVVDGSAQWTCEAISEASLASTVASVEWVADSPIAIYDQQLFGQVTLLLADSSAAVSGTDYDLTATAMLANGQQLVGTVRLKVY
jgi:hypothetical protein